MIGVADVYVDRVDDVVDVGVCVFVDVDVVIIFVFVGYVIIGVRVIADVSLFSLLLMRVQVLLIL